MTDEFIPPPEVNDGSKDGFEDPILSIIEPVQPPKFHKRPFGATLPAWIIDAAQAENNPNPEA